MPADITELDGVMSFAANWERGHPWHLLGNRVGADMSIEEGLELIGVGYEVVYPANLHTIEDDKVFDTNRGPAILLSDLEVVDGQVGIKSSVFRTMSTASPSYEITQRREILELAYEIVGLDRDSSHTDTIGNLGEKGETFFAYIQVPDLVIDPHGIADVIERGLFVGTSFDGSLSNTIGYSNIRVVCANTMAVALPNLQQAIRVKHTKNSEERMMVAAQAMHYVGAVEKKMVEQAESMLRVVDGDKALTNILDHFYPLDDKDLKEQTKNRRLMERGQVRTLYEGEGNLSVDLVGRNGYGAYQAFTDYIDHQRSVRAKGKNEDRVRAQGAVLPGKWWDMKIQASQLVLQ